jgi:hypothetical protein
MPCGLHHATGYVAARAGTVGGNQPHLARPKSALCTGVHSLLFAFLRFDLYTCRTGDGSRLPLSL